MIHFSLIKFSQKIYRLKLFLFLLILLDNVILNSTELTLKKELEYANSLYNTKDYYRAITEYKKMSFFTDDVEIKNYLNFQICKSYYKSNKLEMANEFLSELMSDEKIVNNNILYNNVINYYYITNLLLKNKFIIQDLNNKFIDINSIFLLDQINTIITDKEKGEDVKLIISKDSVYDELINDMNNSIVKYNQNKTLKSLTLAGILSTIFPGLGQIYSGHYFDAFQAIVFVGSLTVANYAAYKYDSKYNNNYILTIGLSTLTGIFYTSNIFGAVKTADYYNYKSKNEIEKILMIESEKILQP